MEEFFKSGILHFGVFVGQMRDHLVATNTVRLLVAFIVPRCGLKVKHSFMGVLLWSRALSLCIEFSSELFISTKSKSDLLWAYQMICA